MKPTHISRVLAFLAASAVISSLAIALVTLTGCSTTGSMTSAQRTQVIDDTAVLLRSAARNGAIFAIEDDPGSARWFKLAEQSLAAFVTGKDYSPALLQQALAGVPIKELKQKWIKYAVYNVVDLYQLYYGRYVQGNVQNNEVAKKFLEAIQDGFKQALEAGPPSQ